MVSVVTRRMHFLEEAARCLQFLLHGVSLRKRKNEGEPAVRGQLPGHGDEAGVHSAALQDLLGAHHAMDAVEDEYAVAYHPVNRPSGTTLLGAGAREFFLGRSA